MIDSPAGEKTVHHPLAVAESLAGPADGHFHHLVADVARRRPDAVAVAYGDTRLTYGELNESANRLAQVLIRLGTGPGARVGVCLERSPESILTQLAIFKTGAAAVLLDPEYPQERLRFMLADSAAVAVVTRAELVERVGADCPVIRVDDPGWRTAEARDPQGPVTDDTVCHIAYTSGSTGVSKAVMLRHGPMRNTIWVLRDQCGIGEDSHGTWLCSPGFGLVEVDCFPLLAAGATVHIPDPDVAASPEELRDWLVSTGITQSLVLTAMAERLWGLSWPDGTALRVMRIAGERVRTWPPAHLPFHVLNVYGSAEATVVATCDLTATAASLTPERRAELMPPVGTAVANVRIYVLDPDLRPVPAGVAGELYISGASLSKGYLNRPDVSSAKFLANTIPGDPYPVLYRSGDIARTWVDGTVEIVGRTDDQVKIRGYLVHLGEVESVLAGQPGVRQCAVLAREDVPGERRLIAYIESSRDQEVSVPALRRAMAERLPSYMVPAAYVVADLPTNANGKIDRARLPAPPRSRPELDVPYVAPRDELEGRLAALWADVLDLDEAGVEDSFFELGGDSLRATRLLTLIRAELDLEVGMADLFRAPSVAEIARRYADQGPQLDGQLTPDPVHRYAPFPLTTAQRAHLASAGPGSSGGRDHLEWDREWLDVERFRSAFTALRARHDALRTVLHADGDQVVLPPDGDDGIVVTDLRALASDEAERAADALRQQLFDAPSPRPGEPLYELRLVLLPDDAVRIHFGVHRAVADAHSIHNVLVPQLSDLYEDPELVPAAPELTFRDHASTAPVGGYHEVVRDAVRAAALNGSLAATPFLHHGRAYGAWHWTGLAEQADRVGITPAALVLGALARTISAYDGYALFATDLTRPPVHPDIAAIVGDFSSYVPLDADAEAASTWPEPLRLPGGAVPLVVTSLIGHPPISSGSALGQETRGRFGALGAPVHLLIRVVDGCLRLDWNFPSTATAGHTPDIAKRLVAACEIAIQHLSAPTSLVRDR